MKDIQFKTPSNFHYSVSFNDLNITSDELLKASGDEAVCLNEYFIEIANETILYAKLFPEIKADFCIKKVKIQKSIVFVNKIELNIGAKIASLFKGSEWAAFFVATAGHSFEKKATALLKEGKHLESYFIDLLGSLAIEKGMDLFQNKLSTYLQNFNLKITNRYSPGYCKWKVDDQFILFKLVDEINSDITLNENALMSPIKSVSGMIGIGLEVNYLKHNCDLCDSQHCIYRKA